MIVEDAIKLLKILIFSKVYLRKNVILIFSV